MKRQRTAPGKIRYAVVGLGHIAQVAVLPAFRGARNSEIAALVSGEAKKLKKMGRLYGVESLYSYDDYDRALEEVDAVYLAVPNHLPRACAVRAARAGVHVLCEKPMAVTEQECREMIQAAGEAGIKLMIAYRLHFEAGNLEAVRLVQSGKLGGVRLFASEFAQNVAPGNIRLTEPSERGGGPLYDMGVYCINAARYLFRSEPLEVMARNVNNGEKRFKQVEEMSSAVMRFPGERLAAFTCSFGAADVSRYTVLGTKGMLEMDPAYEYSQGLQQRVTVRGKTRSRKFPKRDQFAAELAYFSNCVLKDKEPEPSGLEGLADVRIVQAIYESARTGKTVSLPELPPKERPTARQQIRRPAHGMPETIDVESPSGEAA